MHIDNEQMRFGSARWAGKDDIRRAGLFGRHGLPIGFHGRRPMRLEGDHWLVVGGAGSGKGRDILGPLLMRGCGARMLVNDPRGELAAITIHNFIRWRSYAYCFNPCGLHPHILPKHRINPLDILKFSDPRLHADAKFIAEALVPLSGSANGRHFELTARSYIEAFMKVLVEVAGRVTFPMLYQVVNAISADREYLNYVLDAMAHSPFEDVQSVGGDITDKMRDAPREFSGIVGTIRTHLGFLSDPMLLSALEDSDFSLADFTDPVQSISVFLNIPIEYVGIWSPLLRVIFMVTRLYKARAPESPRVTLVVDEAGQMGRFEGLLSSLTYGRGMGLRVIPVYQDLAQISRAFDMGAIQSFVGSAQYRVFLGTRDPQTAGFISDMVGSETLSYDDTLQQETARRQRWEAARGFMEGGDPLKAAFDFAHYGEAAQNRAKIARPLITPSEVLALPDHRMVAFLSGLDVPPMLADKYPYWEQRDLNGYWLPNPYHPPQGRVRLRGRWRRYWRDIVTEDAPAGLAHYPQLQSGRVQYVTGHRPW